LALQILQTVLPLFENDYMISHKLPNWAQLLGVSMELIFSPVEDIHSPAFALVSFLMRHIPDTKPLVQQNNLIEKLATLLKTHSYTSLTAPSLSFSTTVAASGPSNLSVVAGTVNCLAALCEFGPRAADFKWLFPVLTLLVPALYYSELNILEPALRGLCYFAMQDEEVESMAFLLQPKVIRRLIQLLRPSTQMQIHPYYLSALPKRKQGLLEDLTWDIVHSFCLEILTHLTMTEVATEQVLQCGLFEVLLSFVEHSDPDLRVEAWVVVGNVAAGNVQQVG
jgi:hypothetical protein